MISRNKSRDFLVAQRPLIAFERLAQHLRLALGTIEIDRLAGLAVLEIPTSCAKPRALVEQRMNARIDRHRCARGFAEIGRAAAPAAARPGAALRRRRPGVRVPARAGASQVWLLWLAMPAMHSSRVPALELAHEADQRLDAGERHGVVQAGAHAAEDAMALEIGEAGRGRLLEKRRVEFRLVQA